MAKGNKKSVPSSATSRDKNKSVKTSNAKNTQTTSWPSWRFSTVDSDGPFAWPKDESDVATIVKKLYFFDGMTWADIVGKQHHFLNEESLSKDAKKRLEEINLDDEVENLFSFHLQGKPRIICRRHNNLALLLWYDPKHLVAPSKKKHT